MPVDLRIKVHSPANLHLTLPSKRLRNGRDKEPVARKMGVQSCLRTFFD